ncbi:MAG: hypothetical protein EA343_01305 [Nodularia sp. (in: Bacteria)]|nr:MAG: hypothetical protein EA343_01305 [Nodularia sp. (in: cyanobacteria)]
MNNVFHIFTAAALVVSFVTIEPSSAKEKDTSLLVNHTSSTARDKFKIAQGTTPRVIRLRLADDGVSVGSLLAWGPIGLIQRRATDWVRLEIRGNQVKVIHTTRTTNWLTQFSNWWDHPVRKLAFKPDSCDVDSEQNQGSSNTETQLREIKRLYESELITEKQYQELQQKIISQVVTGSNQSTATAVNCVVSGEDGQIELEDISLLSKGTFQIEYLESDEWRYAAFRVPEKAYE